MVRKTTIAIILSILIPGIGQAYLGQFFRGAAIFAIGIAIALTLYYLFGTNVAILTSIYWGWNIIDVYTQGKGIAQNENKTKSKQCPSCDGRGAVRTGSSMASIFFPSLSFTRCPSCGGTGTLPVT